MPLDGLLDKPLRRAGFGDVGFDKFTASAKPLNLTLRGLARFAISTDKDHIRTQFSQANGDRPSDSGCRTGYQCRSPN
jgi:hypothetical protein